MEKFKKLGISEPILNSIKESGFETPTEIQEKTIPLILKGKDVIAGAATGSGKTLAFGSGLIQNSERQGVIQSLILVPTRELAEQVGDEIIKFSKYKKLNIAKIYGGVAISPQIQNLRKADVVVGTPGRMLDHLRSSNIELGYVKTLVLDEADRMLDMGFIDDVNKIISQCPRDRQTLLFSATLSVEVLRLSDNYLNNPVEITAESKVDPTKLTQYYYDVPDNLKFSLFVHLLKKDHSGLVMVFCNTQRNTDFVARNLSAEGINALAIHGGHSQDKRKKTLQNFHSKEIQVLVCTDVAARGLDIKDVSHVYNYDIPMESNNYIHRIGRTARAGKEGMAVTILASRDYDNFRKLMNVENLPIKKLDLPEFPRVFIKSKETYRPRSGGRSSSFRRPRNSSSSGGYSLGRGESREGRRNDRRGSRSRDTRREDNRSRDRRTRPAFGKRRFSNTKKRNFSSKRKRY